MPTVETPTRLGLSEAEAHAKHAGQKERILDMLKRAGEDGCTSEVLNRVAFRYASVIHRLRRDGFLIETADRHNTELARYIYKGNTEANGQLLIPGA